MKLIFPLQLTSKNVLISLSNSTTLFTHDRVKEHLNNDYSSIKKHIPTWQGTISNESIDIKIIVHRKRDRTDLKHFLYRLPLSPLEPLNPKPLYSFISHPSVQNRPRRGLPDRWFWKHRIPRARQLQTDAELYQVHRSHAAHLKDTVSRRRCSLLHEANPPVQIWPAEHYYARPASY